MEGAESELDSQANGCLMGESDSEARACLTGESDSEARACFGRGDRNGRRGGVAGEAGLVTGGEATGGRVVVAAVVSEDFEGAGGSKLLGTSETSLFAETIGINDIGTRRIWPLFFMWWVVKKRTRLAKPSALCLSNRR